MSAICVGDFTLTACESTLALVKIKDVSVSNADTKKHAAGFGGLPARGRAEFGVFLGEGVGRHVGAGAQSRGIEHE